MKTHRRIRTILLTGALGLCLAGMLRADNQYPHPWFDAHPNPAWLGTAVELDAGISVDPDGWLEWMDWDWDNDGTWDETVAFGDGTISHTFTQAGEQTVSLRVTDNEGGWCTISLPVEIYDPADPVVRFYVNNDPQVNGLDSPGYGKSPETPFDTIQYALNAVDGTTDYFGDIVVAPGTYAEHIQFQGKHVILTSQDPDDPAVVQATIIDGQNATNPPQPTVRFDGSEDDRTQLRGLTITGGSGLPYPDSGSDSYGGGIWGAHADVTISRCIIRDNAVTGKGGGVCVIEGLIDRCVFYNNTAGTGGGGLSGCIYATIQNCLVHHNDGNGGAGGILNSTNGQILNCTVADNDGAGLENCDRNIITNCIVWGNNAAAQLVNCAHPTYSCIEDYTPADYQRVVGYWMLDETSGTIAVDAVAPCHNGTVNGGYWDEDGVRNGCLGFDGYYDYVSVGDHADFDTRDELSLVFWFQTETAQGYNKIICHDSSDSKYVVHILDDSATLRFQVKLDSGTYTAEATRPTGSWADGVWHLAACTYNKGAHQLRIYVDGQLCICQDCPREFIPYGDQGILIGYYGSSYDYIGRLDETAVYDRTLAAGEVGVLYLQGLAGYGLGLETNINSNPAFVDPDGPDDVLGTPDDDYHLQAASACIDAGDPTAECDQEPDGGNGRINMGAYGNTDQAALADADADGMPDAWEQAYWPNDDPSAHDPGDDGDGDGLVNLVEYQIDWDPTQDDSAVITVRVTNDQTGWVYPSLATALDWAGDSSQQAVTLLLGAGEYRESLSLSGRNVVLSSVDPYDPLVVRQTVINGAGLDGLTFIGPQGDGCAVRGLTIRGCARGIVCDGASPTIARCVIESNGQGGIFCRDSAAAISQCVLYRNRAENGGALYCEDASPSLSNCVLAVNQAGAGGAVYNLDSSPTLLHCTLYDNAAVAGHGGALCNQGASSPQIISCILWNNTASSSGAELYNDTDAGSAPVLDYCCVEGRVNGDKCDGDNSEDLGTNTCADPLFCDRYDLKGPDHLWTTTDDGLRPTTGSDCADAARPDTALSEDIGGAVRIDIPGSANQTHNADKGAYEARLIWHVKADAGGTGSGLSWQDAFGTLQEALAQTTGTEIWLAAGSYSPGSQRTAAFVPQNGSFQPVTLAGGFAGWETSRRQRSDKTPPSILDGQGVNYHVVVGANGAVLERLHIVNGRADGSASLGQGGAIRLDGVSLYVVDCVLRDNYAVYGGAVYAEQTSSTWRNCSFIDNYAEQAGGGCYFVQTGGLLSGCTFSGNASGDQGGGLYLTGSTVAVSGCRFHQNESKYGAGLAAGSTASAAENTVFYGNIATMDGGGCFHGPGGDLAYVNCTWALNQADRGGAMHQLDASPTIHNSILWFDCAGPAQANPEISNEGDASPLFGFCNLQGCGGSLLGFWNETLGRDGGYNIDTAPVFEDLYNPVGADGVWATRDDGLHVCCYKRAGSLFVPQARRGCLDSANGHIAPPRDITGRIRNDVAYISNGGQGPLDYADLGAYESPTVWYVDSQAGGSSCGRCWQDAFISLDAALAAAGTFAGAFDPAGRDPNSYYPEEIWIAEGTYFPLAFGWQQQASFQLKTGLALYGGFAGQETNLNQRDWLEHETILAGTGSDPVLIGGDHAHLDGLTVTGGYNDSGGGLLASQIEMTLRHCIFRSNSAYPRGGAICQEGGILRGEDCLFEFNFGSIGGAINSCGGTLELYNCLFQNNQANGFTAGFGTGGAVHFKGTLLRLENCCFDENQAGRSGGALWAAGRYGRILDCNFQSNQVNGVTYFGDGRGGACTNSNLRDGVYARCVFAGNSIMYGSVKAGLGGGLYNEQSRIDLVNCVLYHNQASEGGGIYNNQCEHVAILHTTFDSNIASDYAGAVVNYQTDPRITNCILWNDWVGGLVKEVYDKYSSSNPADSLVVSCDLGEGEGDRDCICVDPQYLAPSNPWGPDLIAGTADDGLQLSSPSGCVDQGQDLVLRDPNLAAFICVDLAGVPRRQHGGSSLTADLGAFEFGGIVAPDQTGIQTNQDTPCTITPDATDIASEPLTIEVVQAPSLGTVEVGPDGSLLYTPNPYAHGEDSFRYRASDGVNSAYATVSLTILDADDGPVAVDDVVHVQQGQYLGVDIDVLDNDDHPDEGSSMNLVAVSESTDDYTITISNNTVHLTWDQEYEGSPDRTITFTYEVEDDDEDPGKDSDTGNVTVHLHVPPEAQDDDFTLPAGAVGRLAVFANDIDDDGDGLQLDSFQYPEPGGERHGTLVYHGGGVFTYRPFDGFCGDDSFYYTLIDPAGNLSNTVDVALTVSDTVEFQDADGDGVSDTDEGQYSTDPTLADTDGDGLDDGWEIHWQRPGALAIDPLVWSDPDGDPDGDQLSNQDEQRYGLDPFDPDSDQDGCSDYVEVLEGLDPLRPDGTVGAASTIPYHTSFDWSEFTCFTSIHGQNGWQVENKSDHDWAQVEIQPVSNLLLWTDTLVSKEFEGNCPATTYVKVSMASPWYTEESQTGPDAEIHILSGGQVIAAVKLRNADGAGNYYLAVWNPQTFNYVDTGVSWEWMFTWWSELWFRLDFTNHQYQVLWLDRPQPDVMDFTAAQEGTPTTAGPSYSIDSAVNALDKIEFETSGHLFLVNTMSISGSYNQPADESVEITYPCHCDGQICQARVPVVGRIEWDRTAYYELGYCPGDLNPYDPGNWCWFHRGSGMVSGSGVLGYWDTARLPNGYYYLGLLLVDEMEPCARMYTLTEDNTFNPWDSSAALAPLVLMADKGYETFFHAEQPEISASWPGQFPFDLSLCYNDKLASRPSCFRRGGWSHNHQIMLQEDTRFYWAASDGAFGTPYTLDNNNGLAHGDIWLRTGEGVCRLFRYDHESNRYYPFVKEVLDADSGEYIERTSGGSLFYVTSVHYTWVRPDGRTLTFETASNFVLDEQYYQPGKGLLCWQLAAYLATQADRFGNTLKYTWNVATSNKPAVTKIQYDPDGEGGYEPLAIYLDWSGSYYEGARLQKGDTVYRRVRFEPYYNADLFRVYRQGRGVDADGELHADQAEHVRYYFHWAYGLEQIIYDASPQAPANLVLSYDPWGRVQRRFDLLGSGNYRRQDYEYEFYHPVSVAEPWQPGQPDVDLGFVSYQKITTSTYLDPQDTASLDRQDIEYRRDTGAVFRREVLPYGGGLNPGPWDPVYVTQMDLEYGIEDQPFLPTQITESIDIETQGQADVLSRYTTRTYDTRGNLTAQRTCDALLPENAEQCLCQVSTYHPYYSLPTSTVQTGNWDSPGAERQEVKYTYGRYVSNEPQINHNPGRDDCFLMTQEVLLDGGGEGTWAQTDYRHDPATGLVTEQTDPRGVRTVYQYDVNNYLNRVFVGEPEEERVVQVTCHDTIGQLIWQADAYGKVTRNFYDDFGRLYCQRVYVDPDVLNLLDGYDDPNRYDHDKGYSCQSVCFYGYDNQGQRTYQQTASGGRIRTKYSYANQPPREILYDLDDDGQADPEEAYTQFHYDNLGRKDLQRNHYPAAGVQPERWAYQRFEYDPLDRLRLTEWYDYGDGEGGDLLLKCRWTDYDGAGRKIHEEIGGPADGEVVIGCRETYFEYDLFDHVTERRLRTHEELPETYDVTRYLHDFAGNRTAVIDPLGNITFSDYDNAGRMYCQYFAETLPAEYDQTDIDAARGQADRALLTDYYLNNSIASVVRYDYAEPGSNIGQILSHTAYAYDDRGRLTSVEQFLDEPEQGEPTKAVTEYAYADAWETDEDLARVIITNATGNETSRWYDPLGSITRVDYPSSGDAPELFEYNGDGSLSRENVFGPDGTEHWIEYDYDAYGRLETTTYPDDGTVTYLRDGFGRTVQITDNRATADNIAGTGTYVSTILFDYDTLDRQVLKRDQDGYSVLAGYRGDNQKRYIRVTDPQSNVVYNAWYFYWPSGRLASLSESETGESGNIAFFTYDDAGNRESMQYYLEVFSSDSVVQFEYGYNAEHRLTNLSATSAISGQPAELLFSQTGAGGQGDLAIDGLGRLTAGSETIRNVSGADVTHDFSYTYDMLGELTTAEISNIAGSPWQANYNYHPDGDLASRQINADPAENFIIDGDYLTDLAGVSLGWDDNGNLSRFGPEPQPQATYGFNWDNQLRTATVDGKTISFRYDPDGSRIERTCDDGQTTTSRRYVLGESGGLPVILLELAPKANPADGYDIAKSYYYVNDELVAQYDGPPFASDRYFYVADRLGSVRQVIDVNASVRHLYTYGPFGKKLESQDDPSDPPGNPFQFTGQYFDEDLNQLYLRARQYSPDLSRFTARDPVLGDFQEPLTLHAYLYCLNDPINGIDLTGESYTYHDLKTSLTIAASTMGTIGYRAGMGVANFARNVINNLVGFRSLINRLALSGNKGLDYAIRLGKIGEKYASNYLNLAKNTQWYYTTKGNYRIPDFVDGAFFYEAKNVQYISITKQIRDFLDIAKANNGTFTLIVRKGTQLSKPLQKLIKEGKIQLIELFE